MRQGTGVCISFFCTYVAWVYIQLRIYIIFLFVSFCQGMYVVFMSYFAYFSLLFVYFYLFVAIFHLRTKSSEGCKTFFYVSLYGENCIVWENLISLISFLYYL